LMASGTAYGIVYFGLSYLMERGGVRLKADAPDDARRTQAAAPRPASITT
jgi:hypothetical protein